MDAPDLSYIAEGLRSLALPIASLTLDPANARKHPERNLAAVENSLRRFGQRIPIVVQKQGMVVRAGNARLDCAKKLGWTHIAALVVDESDVTATAFAIADNRTAELAQWDDDVLAAILHSLQTADFPIIDIGFSLEDLQSLTSDSELRTVGELPTDTVFRVLVTCNGEQDQGALLTRLEAEGYKCQLLMS